MSYYKHHKVDISNILNLTFTLVAIVLLVILLFAIENDVLTKSLTYIIPLAAPIVLLLAFRESKKANSIQTSAHFYEDEARKIPVLPITKEYSYRSYGGLGFDIGKSPSYSRSMRLIDFASYLEDVSKAFRENKDTLTKYYSDIHNHHHEVKRIDEFLTFYDRTYLPAITEVIKKKNEINSLYKQKFLIPKHKQILFDALYSQIEEFWWFSKSLLQTKNIFNPSVSIKRKNKRIQRDFFNISRVRRLSEGIYELVPPLAKL